ncbi:hypothetical protein WICMUC_001936 [Wickerhamomyces mucosus]|uniref:Vacuolar fusion protein MON1 n=1 Tax=Wickerhamomyces mucosus TaxID=1378264 RepID=A0A9P8TFU0_9ASCO|nr:hypothetical protein WICMUC_001936 [Wickerhamomyces mucosus]
MEEDAVNNETYSANNLLTTEIQPNQPQRRIASVSRPPVPTRPQKRPSLSSLTLGGLRSNIKVSELQAQPTTEISFQNIGKSNNFTDTNSIYAPSTQSNNFYDNSDVQTIRTNPTLTIYSDEDDGDQNSFTSRLEQIISHPNSDLKFGADESFAEAEDDQLPDDKQFFILSNAGKLIYATSGGAMDDQNEVKYIGYVGVIQTVVNSFLLDGSELKSIVSGSTRITIMNQSPIILVAVSKLKESEQTLLNQLDLIYSFLLSTLSKPQIIRSFQNKEGFDLRKHLGRADLSGLDALCREIINFDAGVLVGAIESVRLRKTTREKLSQMLINNRNKDVLYGLLVDPSGRLISVMRPKTYTLHTTDLQVLFSLVFNQWKSFSDGEELWLPVCLSKFNSAGFLYAFAKSLGSFALILIGADKTKFFEMRETAQKMLDDLETKNLLNTLKDAITRPLSTFEIPAPLVNHFIYKSKRHLQYITPSKIESKKLKKYYLKLYSSVDRHTRISVSYLRWDKSAYNGESYGVGRNIAGLGWVTPNYELYLITGSVMRKDMLVKSAKSIVNWCRKNEERLFVYNGATF